MQPRGLPGRRIKILPWYYVDASSPSRQMETEMAVREEERAMGVLVCANCGCVGPGIAGGELAEGEAVCSVACYDQHMELGCPLEMGVAYRLCPHV